MKANEYFLENLIKLKESKNKHKARAKYKDGVDAYKTSIYNVFEKYNKNELPLHTFRSTAVKSAINEMLWIYKDQNSTLKSANKRGVNWWNDFNIGDDSIGTAYGFTVKYFDLVDTLLRNMELDPFSQRHLLSLWQQGLNNHQDSVNGLVPCAYSSHFNVIESGEKRLVNMNLNIRSSDYITAGAINRIQYYCLGLMICGHLTYKTGILHEVNEFSVLTNDLHVYDRHEFAIDELLNHKPSSEDYLIELKGFKNFYEYDIDDFIIKRPSGLFKLSKYLELAV